MKKEIYKCSRANRKEGKAGPVGVRCPISAIALERDGPRDAVVTKVAAGGSFGKLREVLAEWSTCRVWDMLYPIENVSRRKSSRSSLVSSKPTYRMEERWFRLGRR